MNSQIYKLAIDYLVENVGASEVYSWKLTDKSLVYYLYAEDGKKGKRFIVPIVNLRK